MKVKELVKKLLVLDQELEVSNDVNDGQVLMYVRAGDHISKEDVTVCLLEFEDEDIEVEEEEDEG